MVSQIVTLAAFLAACSAAVVPAHVLGGPVLHSLDVPSAPAHYDFGYTVSDPLTGDNKEQTESRRGDVVQGRYSLLESDGTKRIVEYTADDVNGFNAVVHKEPTTGIPHLVEPKVALAPARVALNPIAPVPFPRVVAPTWNGLNPYNGLAGYTAPYTRGLFASPHSGYAHPYAAPYSSYGSPYNYGGYATPYNYGGHASPYNYGGYASPYGLY